MGFIAEYIKNHAKIKQLIHWLLIPPNQAKPRIWVSILVNPFFHKRGKGSIIRRRTRLDVIPFQAFELGSNSIIEDFATINNGVGPVCVGTNTLVGISSVIIGPVTLGNNVILAQHVVISGLNHRYSDPIQPIKDQSVETKMVRIHDDCWIGANALITAGITIGKHAVVAGGAVVTKDVPPFTVVAGNPAKPIRQFNSITGNWEKVLPI
jgi:acetyltransferase-like isoleucine patch superfamily enzyme